MVHKTHKRRSSCQRKKTCKNRPNTKRMNLKSIVKNAIRKKMMTHQKGGAGEDDIDEKMDALGDEIYHSLKENIEDKMNEELDDLHGQLGRLSDELDDILDEVIPELTSHFKKQQEALIAKIEASTKSNNSQIIAYINKSIEGVSEELEDFINVSTTAVNKTHSEITRVDKDVEKVKNICDREFTKNDNEVKTIKQSLKASSESIYNILNRLKKCSC